MTTAELCERADLDEEARQLAEPEMPVRMYVEQLAAGGYHRAAIAALLHLLPQRDAIAWSLESVRKIELAAAKPNAGAVLQAVEEWVEDPTDERRRAAMTAAEQAGTGTPVGCLGLAVFLSGGSMAPPHVQQGPEPAPYLYAKAAGGAMAMAAVQEPRKAADCLRVFLDRGFERAGQLKIWEEEK
jgi:hypothetical protein